MQDWIARLFSMFARLVSPSLQGTLERWATNLAGDVPRIGAAWVVRFRYPTPDRSARPCAIDARLHQFGRRVSGIGFVEGEPGDPFRYEGFIRRNVFFGTFRRNDPHVLAGIGVFVLKIAADSRQMTGRCAWYQSQVDGVWPSRFLWRRRS